MTLWHFLLPQCACFMHGHTKIDELSFFVPCFVTLWDGAGHVHDA